MKVVLILIPIVLCASTNLFNQKEDFRWIFGYSAQPTVGSNEINFKHDPPLFTNVKERVWDMSTTNTSICDKSGNLLLFSNGMVLIDSMNKPVLCGGDSISYDLLWESSLIDQINWKQGKPFSDQMVIVPSVTIENHYYILFDLTDKNELLWNRHFAYALIEAKEENSRIVQNNKIILSDTLARGAIELCKHSNGRDWWIIKPNYSRDKYSIFLLSDMGFELKREQIFDTRFEYGIGQSEFSPCGNYIGFHSVNKIPPSEGNTQMLIFKFNRCDGILTDLLLDTTINSEGLHTGITFSSNSRFCYASNAFNLIQYDLDSENILESKIVIHEGDLGEESFKGVSYMKLGPDGKIYVSHLFQGGESVLSIINKPNQRGADCDFQLNAVSFEENYHVTMPNIPNFRLGPIDGSDCDTLGIDNHPISKFRYIQDSSDFRQVEFVDLSFFRPEEWTWSFGDSELSNEQHPIHSYASNGIYEVCLRVSNENSSNSSCRDIQIGPSSNIEIGQVRVELFPNPVRDKLLVNLLEYLPQSGKFELFSLEGEIILSSAVNYGWNCLDVSKLSPGTYIYQAKDGEELLKVGKLVKL